MGSSPNFVKPSTRTFTDEQPDSSRNRYPIPYYIALDVYLHTFLVYWKQKLGS